MNTPVALLIFNRPEWTGRVFSEVAKAKPRKLLVVADGPRAGRRGEAERCAEARAIVERVDWECEVARNYSDVNLGCRRRVATGISWVFEQVEEAIILEDDCVPDPTFFRFCEELLERYRGDERIMHITGSNFLGGKNGTRYSYFFSRYNPIWGWASWRRAWRYYDVDLRLWPTLRSTDWLRSVLGGARQASYWRDVLDRTHAGNVDTWDYQWTFTCWAYRGLSIVPNVNLIKNIGFGEEATHTKSAGNYRGKAHLPTEAMTFPLRHPPCVEPDQEIDRVFWAEPRDPRKQASAYHWLRGKVRTIISALG